MAGRVGSSSPSDRLRHDQALRPSGLEDGPARVDTLQMFLTTNLSLKLGMNKSITECLLLRSTKTWLDRERYAGGLGKERS